MLELDGTAGKIAESFAQRPIVENSVRLVLAITEDHRVRSAGQRRDRHRDVTACGAAKIGHRMRRATAHEATVVPEV